MLYNDHNKDCLFKQLLGLIIRQIFKESKQVNILNKDWLRKNMGII